MRNISDKVAEKIKTRFIFGKPFFRKSCHLWDTVEKYGRAPLVTDKNMIRRMCFARGITKAKDTYSEDVIPIAFPW